MVFKHAFVPVIGSAFPVDPEICTSVVCGKPLPAACRSPAIEMLGGRTGSGPMPGLVARPTTSTINQHEFTIGFGCGANSGTDSSTREGTTRIIQYRGRILTDRKRCQCGAAAAAAGTGGQRR